MHFEALIFAHVTFWPAHFASLCSLDSSFCITVQFEAPHFASLCILRRTILHHCAKWAGDIFPRRERLWWAGEKAYMLWSARGPCEIRIGVRPPCGYPSHSPARPTDRRKMVGARHAVPLRFLRHLRELPAHQAPGPELSVRGNAPEEKFGLDLASRVLRIAAGEN